MPTFSYRKPSPPLRTINFRTKTIGGFMREYRDFETWRNSRAGGREGEKMRKMRFWEILGFAWTMELRESEKERDEKEENFGISNRFTIPTMKPMHRLSYQQTLSSTSAITCFSRLQLLTHIVRRIAFNLQLVDHAARTQLGAAGRCISPSKNKPTPPPGANKKRKVIRKAPVDWRVLGLRPHRIRWSILVYCCYQ